jgi:molecular chaperone GrpE
MMVKEDNSKHEEMLIPVTGPDDEDKVESETPEPECPEVKESDTGETHYLEHLRRLQAEFDNYRKRVKKENESLYAFAQGDLMGKLLPVIDDLERMLNHDDENSRDMIEGIRLIYKNLNKILVEQGLKEIPAVGESFDPEQHEAVGVEEVGENQDGIVTEEWQKGYRFGGRLLRPSRVKVGKAATKTSDE